MKNRFLKAAALLCAAAVGLAVFAACGNKGGAGGEDVYYWTQEQYLGADSSDIPSTDLEPWELTAWNANGTGGFGKTESSQDVVSAEIMRVTGLGIDPDTSFDNQGQSVAAALGTIVMGGGKYYPHIAYGTHEIAEIINAEGSYDLVWDLTDYIEKYCPTIVRRMPEYVWSTSQVTGGNTEGRIYGIPYNLGDVGLSTVDPAADPSKTVMFEYLQNYHGCVYVREDILKDAYPSAHTTEELQALFEKQGRFTPEQLYDVPINSADDFFTFLYRIYDTIHATPSKYRVTYAGDARWVTPILAQDGSDRDNWSPMAGLFPILLGANGYLNTMFSYWDAQEHTVKNMVLQDFFKDLMLRWNQTVREGKLMKVGNGDDPGFYGYNNPWSQIKAELNNGLYAVTYPNALPDGNRVTVNGETIPYRKVYLNIEMAPQFEFFAQSAPVPSSVVIFKKNVNEAQLIQILRWLDFQCSETADLLYGWGPRSAGLFTEENGVRQFKDAQLADQMVYNTGSIGGLVQQYNLANGTEGTPQPTFPFFYANASKTHPKCVYDISSLGGMLDMYYSPAMVDEDNDAQIANIARRADIYTWTESDLEGVTSVWAQRGTVEKAITTVMLSKSDQAFESNYAALKNTCMQVGWTDEYFGGAYTDAFLRLNRSYLGNFKKGIYNA